MKLFNKLIPDASSFLLLTFYFSLLASLSFAQTEDVKVSHLSFSEQLTDDDEVEPGFGRFDAYEVYFHRFDRVIIHVNSADFSPTIVLISPKENHLVKIPENHEKAITFATEIPEDGKWLLVVRGDSTALGKYDLNAWWADENALHLNEEADLCDEINFLIAHANADFYFIRRATDADDQQTSWQPAISLSGAIQSFISKSDGYVARFYQGNDKQLARKIYSDLVGKLKFCNGGTWKESFRDWRVVDILNLRKEMVYQLREKERTDYRYISVSIDDKSADPNARHKFQVYLTINRWKDN